MDEEPRSETLHRFRFNQYGWTLQRAAKAQDRRPRFDWLAGADHDQFGMDGFCEIPPAPFEVGFGCLSQRHWDRQFQRASAGPRSQHALQGKADGKWHRELPLRQRYIFRADHEDAVTYGRSVPDYLYAAYAHAFAECMSHQPYGGTMAGNRHLQLCDCVTDLQVFLRGHGQTQAENLYQSERELAGHLDDWIVVLNRSLQRCLEGTEERVGVGRGRGLRAPETLGDVGIERSATRR